MAASVEVECETPPRQHADASISLAHDFGKANDYKSGATLLALDFSKD